MCSLVNQEIFKQIMKTNHFIYKDIIKFVIFLIKVVFLGKKTNQKTNFLICFSNIYKRNTKK